jgi:predicted TPR repeat methyltransferase
VTIQQAIETARRHHQAGRLADAEAIYRQVLTVEPHHADALHLLGVIAGQRGRSEEAADWIRKAIALRPGDPEAHKNLGVALKAAGRVDEAVAAFRKAIALKPDYADARKNLGSALHQMGRMDEAIAAYREAIALRPGFAEAHDNLGAALRETGRLEDAIAAGRRAVSLKPGLPEAHNNLGNALHDHGLTDDAIASYRTALQLRPGFAQAWNNLGIALKVRGDSDEAIAAFRTAIERKPDYADARINLGNALKDAGRLDEALAAFHSALEVKPDSADAFANLGNALREQGRIAEAIAAYRRAVELKPDSPDWRHVLAALTGDPSASGTPAGYVRKLFDQYARRFDRHLVGQLDYRVPQHLHEAVLPFAPGGKPDILDLGCGTGLCGAAFRPMAGTLAGVDLSPAMIAQAGAKGIYDRLTLADVSEAMREQERAFDLILAGDLFIYVGDLGEVFAAAARALRSGGLFAFSLERHDGEGFVLHSKVRFAHSLTYIRELSRAHRFTELDARPITVRKSGPDDVPGWIVVLRNASAET